jgi:hypothetical protein
MVENGLPAVGLGPDRAKKLPGTPRQANRGQNTQVERRSDGSNAINRARIDPTLSALSEFRLPSPRILGSLPASRRNDNILVQDAAGRRFVLRHYRRNPQRARIEFQVCFQQHLLRRGFPTSHLVETEAGQRVITSGREFWALFTHVDGTEYDYRREAQVGSGAYARPPTSSIGRARLHRAS